MKTKFLLFATLIHFQFFAQQVPTVNDPGGATISGQNSSQYWSRAGNLITGGTNNIFGTKWNSGIYTITNDFFRMKLNGNVNYGINGYTNVANPANNIGKDGYLLLGQGGTINNPEPIYGSSLQGAYSLLHLKGLSINPAGYRPWMKTGITFTDNGDLSYFGLRPVNNEWDITETVLSWSNDGNNLDGLPYGPDDMVFRFTNGSANGGSVADPASLISTDLQSNLDIDGRHVARFTGEGRFALGNTFGINEGTSIYVRPQALLHMSMSNLESVWQQYTNRNTAVGSGTGETANDGLRIGILGNTNPQVNGTAAIYNQELKPILLSTNANSNTINPISGATGERVRITSVNTPTNLPAGGMGIYNPGSIPNNITRMSVSHNPSNPVTRPLSLLHLGYNTGQNSINASSTDGWRPWMDIGAFISDSSDNIYVGLKDEGNDRGDAVINWGDNQNGGITGASGPDNLRFIFTSTTTSFIPGDSVASSLNGLEVARMEPILASTLPSSNFGMMGIGDFSPAGPNTANPVDAKLDIDGDLRVRTVTQQDSLLRVLVIDSADLNRVHYRNIPLNIGTGQGFVTCSDFTPAAFLSSDSKINLNNHNIYFENNDSLGQNHVSVGYKCSSILPGKFSSLQTHPTAINANSTAIHASNIDISNANALTFQGVYGESIGPNTGENYLTKTTQIGGDFFAKNGIQSYGVRGVSGSYPNNIVASTNVGGYFHSRSNLPFNTLGIGVVGISTNAITNYGVYGAAPSGGANRAGYFNGLIEVNTQVFGSDKMFKTDISKIQSGLSIIKSLKPSTYYLDTVNYSQFNFDGNKQYGFIAQDLETVIPEIVHESINPAIIDSLGNEITPALSYKSVNYNAIIPINTQAIKELNDKVDKATLSDASIKTNVQDLSGSLQTILALRGVSFDWNLSVNQEFQFDSINHIGFIAQEVQSIEPRLTFNGDNNLLHVDYNKVVPVLVEAIQEQSAIISHQDSLLNDLTNRLNNLENCINALNLCNQNQPSQMAQPTTGQTITLNTVQSIVLNQNVPNPFAEQTVISYSIPESVQKANILFYDSNGKMINNVDIKERGNSQLNVFANDLSTGIYTYSLVADGQIVATKKMVKQ
jgi:hypothetical protein